MGVVVGVVVAEVAVADVAALGAAASATAEVAMSTATIDAASTPEPTPARKPPEVNTTASMPGDLSRCPVWKGGARAVARGDDARPDSFRRTGYG